MREIKFRGKRTDNKEWVYGDLETRRIDGSTIIHTYNSSDGKYSKQYEVIPKTIGQYTGLKDKNGKEIYDKDILFVKFLNRTTGYRLVGWNEQTASWGVRVKYGCQLLHELREFIEFDNSELMRCINRAIIFEVVGNMYDRSELIGNIPDGK